MSVGDHNARSKLARAVHATRCFLRSRSSRFPPGGKRTRRTAVVSLPPRLSRCLGSSQNGTLPNTESPFDVMIDSASRDRRSQYPFGACNGWHTRHNAVSRSINRCIPPACWPSSSWRVVAGMAGYGLAAHAAVDVMGGTIRSGSGGRNDSRHHATYATKESAV